MPQGTAWPRERRKQGELVEGGLDGGTGRNVGRGRGGKASEDVTLTSEDVTLTSERRMMGRCQPHHGLGRERSGPREGPEEGAGLRKRALVCLIFSFLETGFPG